jgi:hypothetical protein
MKTLRISPDLALPLDTVTSTLIVYGGKGMGKTVFGAVLAEELAAARQRWAWLDPLGVGWGIRHSADGDGKGVECLILGGAHADIPIEPTSGAAVADVVVEESVNVLIDFSRKPSGEMWGVGEKIRFVTAYARRLFQRQGELVGGHRREPLFQILDEGARYIPQTIPAGNPDLAMCVSAWQQFVEEGRNVGLGLCVLTQRSARISKDVAELADAMVAFRTIGPNSLGAVLDWLGEHVDRSRVKDLSAQVRELPRGSALVVSPGWLKLERVVPIRMRNTFDSSATPKAGEKPRRARGEGAKPDLDKIRSRMAETIERAKADDPKALRTRIAELERELAKKPAPGAAAPAPKLEEWEVVVDGRHLKEIVDAAAALEDRFAAFDGHFADLRLAVNVADRAIKRARQTGSGALAKRLAKAPSILPTSAQTRSDHTPKAATSRANPPANSSQNRPSMPKAPVGAAEGDRLPKAERTILTALAQHGALSLTQAAIIAGYSSKSGGMRNAAGALRSLGYATGGNDQLEITPEGCAALGPYDPLPTGAALAEHWYGQLPKAEREILGLVVEAYPRALALKDAAERCGYSASSGGVRNAAGKLRTLDLVIGGNDGMVANERLVG